MGNFISPFWHLTAHRVGHNEVIGVCRAGPDAEGLGRDHWNEMLAYPRKPITHWHALGEVHIYINKSFQTVSLIPKSSLEATQMSQVDRTGQKTASSSFQNKTHPAYGLQM